ncbi:MAG: glycosyltransferase family 4 protein [Anaerolineae bacterium]|nr:glycosyltransferase family 4 protein [Gloeobacterales cyanobacterium ES-bin-313]
MRVLVVAHYASAKRGGEALLPLQYFRILRSRHLDAYLVTHEDARDELEKLFPDDSNYIYYVKGNWIHSLLRAGGNRLQGVAERILWFFNQLQTEFLLAQLSRQLAKDLEIDIVHQPISVSPKMPSLMFALGVPVVIGPMNGNINYPPGMQLRQSLLSKLLLQLGRLFSSNFLNFLFPGKRRAQILLVANDRTRQALPRGAEGEVLTLVENGVDLSIWKHHHSVIDTSRLAIRFIYIGRLVGWKGLDLLLESFQEVVSKVEASLEIVGDGELRQQLENQVAEMGLSTKVRFLGWLSHEECAEKLSDADVFVLPSLLECGGAVVLEAMAMGLPVIASNWGGPADYVDSSCGILVDPVSRDVFVRDFTQAMLKLAQFPDLRLEMGRAGKERVHKHFDWEKKVDQILDIYQKKC